MARLTEYNIDLCKEICEKVSLGSHIKDVLNSNDKYPSIPTWNRWKREQPELLNLYTCSIQDKAEMVIWEINQAMSELKAGVIDAPSARVIIDTYKWMAAKFYPKMFGDKIDITSGNEKINTVDPFAKMRENIELNDKTDTGL